MSATDSDNSIDWLASDNEDSESERETDPCTRTHSQTEAPPTPRALPHLGPSDCDVKKGDRKWREVREPCSAGSPPGRMETYDGAIGLCKTHGEKTNGRNTQQALKRPHSFTEEEERKAQQLNSNMTEKDQFFTRRYRERLSSFQESVAMDRIQRIMGVLQNPRMGEKYINIILKMEEMLKSWFPNVKLQNQPAVAHTETAVPTKRSKVEL